MTTADDNFYVSSIRSAFRSLRAEDEMRLSFYQSATTPPQVSVPMEQNPDILVAPSNPAFMHWLSGLMDWNANVLTHEDVREEEETPIKRTASSRSLNDVNMAGQALSKS